MSQLISRAPSPEGAEPHRLRAGAGSSASPFAVGAQVLEVLGASRCSKSLREGAHLSLRLQSAGMRTASISADDRLLARLQGPPELGEGVEALQYWRERRRRLPRYRFRARREAVRMTLSWEQRVRRALVSQPGVPVAARFGAGLLVARTRLHRWGRRGAIVLTAVTCVAVMFVPFVAAAAVLIHFL